MKWGGSCKKSKSVLEATCDPVAFNLACSHTLYDLRLSPFPTGVLLTSSDLRLGATLQLVEELTLVAHDPHVKHSSTAVPALPFTDLPLSWRLRELQKDETPQDATRLALSVLKSAFSIYHKVPSLPRTNTCACEVPNLDHPT